MSQKACQLRCTWSSKVSTRAGSSPSRLRASRSAAEKAVPLFRAGSRSRSSPRLLMSRGGGADADAVIDAGWCMELAQFRLAALTEAERW